MPIPLSIARLDIIMFFCFYGGTPLFCVPKKSQSDMVKLSHFHHRKGLSQWVYYT